MLLRCWPMLAQHRRCCTIINGTLQCWRGGDAGTCLEEQERLSHTWLEGHSDLGHGAFFFFFTVIQRRTFPVKFFWPKSVWPKSENKDGQSRIGQSRSQPYVHLVVVVCVCVCLSVSVCKECGVSL